MEGQIPAGKEKPRKLSNAFKKLRQKLHNNSGKIQKESKENERDFNNKREHSDKNQEELRESGRYHVEPQKRSSNKHRVSIENDQKSSDNHNVSSGNDKESGDNPAGANDNLKVFSENDKKSLKTEIVSDGKPVRTLLPSSIAGGPKAVEDEEPASKPQKDAPPKPFKTNAEIAGIETSKDDRYLGEEMKRAKEQDNAKGKVPMQPPVVEPPSITHTSSDGSISYFDSAPIANRKTEPPFTTPGYEWASRSNGYDWDTRRVIYGGNVRLGEHYERTIRVRSEALERTYQKVEAQREQPIKVKATGVKTMVASGYWAGSEA